MAEPLDAFEIRETSHTRIAVHRWFEEKSGTVHGFSLRDRVGRLPSLVEAVCAVAPGLRAASLHQVHGDAVVHRDGSSETGEPRADAHFTADTSIALVIKSADCVPILVADRDSSVVGAAHAGWRGTTLRVAARLVESLTREMGCPPERLLALLGPAIGPCCYEVREDVASIFHRCFPAEAGFLSVSRVGSAERTFLDLPAANSTLLVRAGLAEENVIGSGLCTACRTDLFPSYRAAGSDPGRMWSLIARGRVTS